MGTNPQIMPKVGSWLTGLLNAVISGGASAVTSTITVTMIDPKDWSLSTNSHHFIELVGATFAASAVVSMFKYLAQNPIP